MGNKKTANILLTIMGVLIIIAIVARVLTIRTNTFSGIIRLISLISIALYGFVLYKKPHGNLLKFTMLLYAGANILSCCYFLFGYGTIEIVLILASAAICYCAGRLNRIDQNKYLFPIIGVIILVISIRFALTGTPKTFLAVLNDFNFSISYITLVIAYFVRFEEHKMAGLMDVPKK